MTASECVLPADARAVAPPATLTPFLTFVFALAGGVLVANLYYAQALISIISPDLGLHAGLAGLTVTLAQLGYAAGLLLIVSLADLIENRRLILACVAGTVVGLIAVTLARTAGEFLVASFVVGCCASGAQVIVPLAAHLADDARRGRAIGNVMAGVITGILIARPLANFLAAALGWRAVFGVSAGLTLAVGVLLWATLPSRQPRGGMHYGTILASTWRLVCTTPLLRQRAVYQAVVFGTFNLFWTAVPLVLAHRFGFDQRAVALFALAGAGGALAAPLAGRLADAGHTRVGTGVAMLAVALSFVVAGWAAAAGLVLVLGLAAIVLDGATQTNQILSQRAIYGLDPALRGRINAVYMTSIFVAGAAGSAIAAATFFAGGWTLTAGVGAALGVLVLVRFALDERRPASA